MADGGKIIVGVELEDSFAANFARTLQQAGDELMGTLAAAVDGYRASCLGRGYSPEVAEAMALQWHTYVMAVMASVIGKAAEPGAGE